MVIDYSVNSIWASTQQNLSLGFPTQRDSNQSPQLKRLARKLIFSPVASVDMIISKKGITNVLIRLCLCAVWSVPLFFANP